MRNEEAKVPNVMMKRKIEWKHLIVIGLVHVLAVYAIVYAFSKGFSLVNWIMFILLFSSSGLAITLGYHRLVTHQAFKCRSWLKRALMVMGAWTVEGTAHSWATFHRIHHRYTEKPELDPHTPRDGFWWSHMGWIFCTTWVPPAFARMPDLEGDRVVLWQKRYYVRLLLTGFLLPAIAVAIERSYLSGLDPEGLLRAVWEGVLLAGFARTALFMHTTWSVNSLCHLFGSQVKDAHGNPLTSDDSRNNFLLAPFTFGEGWHNNHHVFPACAFLGWKASQFDPGKIVLKGMRRLGWVWDINEPEKYQRSRQKIG